MGGKKGSLKDLSAFRTLVVEKVYLWGGAYQRGGGLHRKKGPPDEVFGMHGESLPENF